MKKIYNAPYFKVVEVKNDIIATSSLNNGMGNGVQGAPERYNIFDEDYIATHDEDGYLL